MKQRSFRIGILTDTEYTPFWAYEMVRMASELDGVEFPLIVLNDDKTIDKRSLFQKVYSRLKIIVTVAYLTLDQRLFKSKPDAFAGRSFKDLFPNADRLAVKPIKTKFRDKFPEEDLKKIEEYDLDIILCRGFRILSGKILDLPKYGVWSYHHGDNDENRGRPAIFYETVERWRTVGTIFQILKEELDNGTVLYKSKAGHRSRYVFRNMNSAYWKSSFFFERCLRELQRKGWDQFITDKQQYQNRSINIYDKPLYLIPSNAQALLLLIQHYWSFFKEIVAERLREDVWHLAFLRKADIARLSMHRFKLIEIPKDRFWADPIAVEYQNKTLVYFEDFPKKAGKGHISVIEIPAKGNVDYQKAKIVLKKNYHLSYPFVFQNKGDLYMVPESASNNQIDLYRCSGEPNEFEFVRTLIPNIKALDSTLLFKDNTWWLFANVVSHPAMSSYEELFLFYTDDLLKGEWIEHPMSPIVSDVSKARPAGQIFEREGALYRPAQICTPVYGFGIAINKIEVLTREQYQESLVEEILPNWDPSIKTIHTISQAGDNVFVDVAKRRFRFN
ncbi:hypothetical protein N9N66_02735 [Schleiferiaceae bacterium]|nr:hypothetical protein [Schleiferiaceae bacterium]